MLVSLLPHFECTSYKQVQQILLVCVCVRSSFSCRRFDCILSAGERVESCRMDPQFSKVLERWVIEPQDLELGEVLGRGGFGVVSAGTWRDRESKVEVRDL